MDPISIKNVDSASKGSGYRWHEDRIPSVLKLLNDKRRDERFFDLSKCRLPDAIAVISRYSVSQASNECVTRDPFEERFLNTFPRHVSPLRAHSHSNNEANHNHQEKR